MTLLVVAAAGTASSSYAQVNATQHSQKLRQLDRALAADVVPAVTAHAGPWAEDTLTAAAAGAMGSLVRLEQITAAGGRMVFQADARARGNPATAALRGQTLPIDASCVLVEVFGNQARVTHYTAEGAAGRAGIC